jgi:hypothetical protein
MSQLFAGAARVKLMPPVGIGMAGYGRRTQPSVGVHDALAASALVLSDGKNKAAIVSVDLLAIGARIADEIASTVERRCGIRSDQIIIAATHTHSGPLFNIHSTPRPDSIVSGARDPDWERSLPAKIAESITNADRQLEPAELRASTAPFTLATNRRLMTSDQEIRLFPNYNGVVDHDLGILGVFRPDRTAIALVLNYPCHAVTLCEDNLLYSRDFPGFAADEIEPQFSQLSKDRGAHRPIAIFLNGATGNIDPRIRGSLQVAEDAGREMARAAIAGLADAKAVSGSSLIARQVPLTLKIKDLGPSLAAARAYLEQTRLSMVEHGGGEYRLGRIREEHQRAVQLLTELEQQDEAMRRNRRINLNRHELSTRLTFITIGDLALIGIPGEAFVEFGLALKTNSGFRHTFVVGYCNDLIGYLPTREAYAAGGYEVRTASVAEGSGELMVTTALASLHDIRAAP